MCNMMLPSHPPSFYYSNNIRLVVQVPKVLTMQSPHTPVSSSLLGPSMFLSTPLSYTLNLWPIALTRVPNWVFLTLLCKCSTYM
jgi:hypothetical protein